MFELGEELTVGRASGCGVALPDDTFVSTLHARVFRRDGSLYVEDLGSTNGTFINDRQVTGTVPLQRGDRLQIGKTVLELAR
jgi:pSer/pThr/pTyr-binding forkhead associated (FHA) protein